MLHKQRGCLLQRAFTLRIQSATPLSVSDVSATNADVTSVTPVSGSTGSYDVGVMAKKSGVVAVSTLAAASTINVDVDTDAPAVRLVSIIGHVLVVVVIDKQSAYLAIHTTFTAYAARDGMTDWSKFVFHGATYLYFCYDVWQLVQYLVS